MGRFILETVESQTGKQILFLSAGKTIAKYNLVLPGLHFALFPFVFKMIPALTSVQLFHLFHSPFFFRNSFSGSYLYVTFNCKVDA